MSKVDSASMNKELRQWLMETKEEVKAYKEKKGAEEKNPSGMCQICGERDAKVVCLKCGRTVCNSCYFKIIGVCKKCIPQDITDKWEGKQPDWEKILGVEWVD